MNSDKEEKYNFFSSPREWKSFLRAGEAFVASRALIVRRLVHNGREIVLYIKRPCRPFFSLSNNIFSTFSFVFAHGKYGSYLCFFFSFIRSFILPSLSFFQKPPDPSAPIFDSVFPFLVHSSQYLFFRISSGLRAISLSPQTSLTSRLRLSPPSLFSFSSLTFRSAFWPYNVLHRWQSVKFFLSMSSSTLNGCRVAPLWFRDYCSFFISFHLARGSVNRKKGHELAFLHLRTLGRVGNGFDDSR